MRRPMVFAAAALGGGIAAAFLLEVNTKIWISMLAAAVVLLLLVKSHLAVHKVCVFLCIFSVGGCLLQFYLLEKSPLVDEAGKTVEVSGLITGVQKKERSITMIVKTQQGRLLVNYYGKLDDVRRLAGRQAACRGELALPQTRRNPGCFDYRLYLQTCKIQVVMTASSVTLSAQKPVPYLAAVSSIKGNFEQQLDKHTDGQTKSLLLAMIFGDKSALDAELYEDFQKNGTAHVLAVSGLHVGLLYGFLVFLWPWKKGAWFYLIALFLLLSYTALAEFSPSVVRAASMITLHMGAKILHRRYDLLSAAAFTFIVMLCFNPLQLFHTGFQLSFLAVASLGVILPFIERKYQGIFLSSMAIQAGMLPYTAYLFNYVSLGAFFVNLPVIFLAGILLPAGICMVLLSYGPDSLFGMGAAFLEQGCGLLLSLNEIFYADGRTSFDVTSPPVFFLGVYYGLLFAAVSEKGRVLFIRKKRAQLAAAAAAVLIVSAVLATVLDDGFSKAQVTFVDVGQGDCLHVRTPEGRNYLIDGGGSPRYDVGKKVLKPYLLKNGVRKIDAAFVTHLHEDHYGGIRSLAQEKMVEQIGVYEGNRVIDDKLRSETGAELMYLYQGQRIELGENVYLDILAPARKSTAEYHKLAEQEEDENASSLIMKLDYGGVTVLITGDIDQDGEQQLVKQYQRSSMLRADIVKIAHHGSKYSSSDLFLDKAAPQAAVYQVGKNNFGHPTQAVLEKCQERDIMIYRNDTSGAIGIFPAKGGRGISIQKMME